MGTSRSCCLKLCQNTVGFSAFSFIWWANNAFSGEPSRGGLADTHALDSSWCNGFHLCPSFVHMPLERCEDTLAQCLMNLDNVPAFGLFWSLITSAIYFFFVESHFNVSMVDAEFVKWTSLANHDQWALYIKGWQHYNGGNMWQGAKGLEPLDSHTFEEPIQCISFQCKELVVMCIYNVTVQFYHICITQYIWLNKSNLCFPCMNYERRDQTFTSAWFKYGHNNLPGNVCWVLGSGL